MTIELPINPMQLEEANFPADLATSLAGQPVGIQIMPEELPATRRIDPNREPKEWSCLIAPDGTIWNDYQPLRISFTDLMGEVWMLPRHWLESPVTSHGPEPDSSYSVGQPVEFSEQMNLPSYWDLLEVNIPKPEAGSIAGRRVTVLVRLVPGEPVKLVWKDSQGVEWRIPHTWRRRRVRLPDREKLLGQGVPEDIAQDFANRIVSVNYHPGSLCCLPTQYRFRDEMSHRYPVYIKDCVLLGYGDAEEHFV